MDSISKKIPIKPTVSADTLLFEAQRPPVKMVMHTKTPSGFFAPKKISHRKSHRLWKILALMFVIGTLSWLCYFTWKFYSISRIVRISSQTSPQTNVDMASTLKNIQALASSIIAEKTTPLKSDSFGRINILLLGKAGEHHPGHDLTDTIMIMSIDTNTKKIALLSLPRDLYVQIPDTHLFTKINAVYQQGLAQNTGVDLIEKTVTIVTGLPIQYSFIIDFDGFEKVIDALGGVNVEVMRDLYDARYPGLNYSYETFSIKKGWQTLDGATALKYVRERHNDPEGDFGRAKRQQQVIQAVKNRAFSLKTFVDVFALNNLLTILGDSVKTTIEPDEINSFIALSKQVDTANITNVVIDAWKPESLLRVSHVLVGSVQMFTLVPRVGNYSEIQDVAVNLFDTDVIKRRETAIAQENASITIVNRSSNPQILTRVTKILQESFGFNQMRIKQQTSTESPQDDSFIRDNTGRQKPFSLDEILKTLPVTIDTSDENILQTDTASSDFVLTLGNNLARDLNFEEDSIDDFKKSENDNTIYSTDITP